MDELKRQLAQANGTGVSNETDSDQIIDDLESSDDDDSIDIFDEFHDADANACTRADANAEESDEGDSSQISDQADEINADDPTETLRIQTRIVRMTSWMASSCFPMNQLMAKPMLFPTHPPINSLPAGRHPIKDSFSAPDHGSNRSNHLVSKIYSRVNQLIMGSHSNLTTHSSVLRWISNIEMLIPMMMTRTTAPSINSLSAARNLPQNHCSISGQRSLDSRLTLESVFKGQPIGRGQPSSFKNPFQHLSADHSDAKVDTKDDGDDNGPTDQQPVRGKKSTKKPLFNLMPEKFKQQFNIENLFKDKDVDRGQTFPFENLFKSQTVAHDDTKVATKENDDNGTTDQRPVGGKAPTKGPSFNVGSEKPTEPVDSRDLFKAQNVDRGESLKFDNLFKDQPGDASDTEVDTSEDDDDTDDDKGPHGFGGASKVKASGWCHRRMPQTNLLSTLPCLASPRTNLLLVRFP
jgi:vacuolar-type H+-ATPase subunit H